MPNWCDNSLTLSHDDPAMIKRAVRSFENSTLLNEFIPCPKALFDTSEGSYGDPLERARLDALREYNEKTYGYQSWYDFAIGEWGTKWDVGAGDITKIDKNNVKFYFQSAWAPPIEAYRKLEDLGFRINAFYYEPGVMFAGQYYDGEDDFYDLSSMDSEQVKDELPVEIDEEFNISEQMSEWESENDEE
jgi:hypothetical protein